MCPIGYSYVRCRPQPIGWGFFCAITRPSAGMPRAFRALWRCCVYRHCRRRVKGCFCWIAGLLGSVAAACAGVSDCHRGSHCSPTGAARGYSEDIFGVRKDFRWAKIDAIGRSSPRSSRAKVSPARCPWTRGCKGSQVSRRRQRDSSLADRVANSFLANDLEDALNQLTPLSRQLLVEHCLEGKSVEEIAEGMKRDVGLVSIWLQESLTAARGLRSRTALAAYQYGEMPDDSRFCACCGAALPRPPLRKRGRPQQYCNEYCRHRARRLREGQPFKHGADIGTQKEPVPDRSAHAEQTRPPT